MSPLEKIAAILSFIGIMFFGASIIVSCQIADNNPTQEPTGIYTDTIIPSLGDDYK